MTGRAYLLVEGHGEVAAAGNLVSRVTTDLGLHLPWSSPLRWSALHTRHGLERAARYVASRGDAVALLVLRDEDDLCPMRTGPEAASWLRSLRLNFRSSIVLLKPEYEVLFLPCLAAMAGKPIVGDDGMRRPGLGTGTTFDGDWERLRDVKGWLSKHFPPKRSYKPTLDQLPMTRMIDLPTLRAASVPCFDTLERAITFLGGGALHHGSESDVYPPPTAAAPEPGG